MAIVFLETTVLTDLLLKKDGSEKVARAGLRRFSEVIAPHFAWKEFKRGPLHTYVWMHNKLLDTKSFSASLSALQKISRTPRRYFTSTIIQSLHTAFVKAFDGVTIKDLQSRYGSKANLDTLHADVLRLELKRTIYSSWPRRKKLFGGLHHVLPCYPDNELVDQGGRIETKPDDCPNGSDCCLKAQLATRRKDIALARANLPKDGRPESSKRFRVLRQIEKHQGRLMTPKDCRDFGDAYFVLFCPKGATILTTNTRDIQPIANGLGVAVQNP
ncbi:hypothetical protein [Bradyrhizobium yuanmingense]|uniref:hypothetical protein n=1 Tax=Bradyrhizobium yuanmingense TaxID=108015 RepID=UPI0023B9B92E|nr:hypothetical protein [Bradyrhizobium yuanmingense]MDF0498100.1 hypothetical protein [Bradyrhizobium yuanmingense]